MTNKPGDSHICENKNARRNFEILDRIEAGIALVGTEVKSIRQGGVSLSDSFGVIANGEVFLLKLNIQPYSHGNRFNHDPLRKRKLLLNKTQIRKLIGSVVEKGQTLVPLNLHWSKGLVKVELALARGKTKGDRREDMKKKSAKKEISRAMMAVMTKDAVCAHTNHCI